MDAEIVGPELVVVAAGGGPRMAGGTVVSEGGEPDVGVEE